MPTSGKLYLELGGMYLHTKEYDKAISYYEKGIDVEPGYPSNYYRLAKIFLNSDEEVWGMISLFAFVFFAFIWHKQSAKLTLPVLVLSALFTLIYLKNLI